MNSLIGNYKQCPLHSPLVHRVGEVVCVGGNLKSELIGGEGGSLGNVGGQSQDRGSIGACSEEGGREQGHQDDGCYDGC